MRDVAFFNAKNMHYSKKKGTPKPLSPALSVGITQNITTQKRFADGESVFEAVSDTGPSGEIGMSAPCDEYERDMGRILDTSAGAMDVIQTNSELHDIYYEFDMGKDTNTSDVVKCWLLNVATTKGALNHSSNNESITFGDYMMPYTTKPLPILKATGTDYERDENGHVYKGYRVIRRPGDDGYDTFHLAAPDNIRALEKVATPTADPAAGAVVADSTVALSTSTAGAKIYYTIDGSTPTVDSTEYLSAIVIDEAKTIKAIAVKAGMARSDVLTAAYTIQ